MPVNGHEVARGPFGAAIRPLGAASRPLGRPDCRGAPAVAYGRRMEARTVAVARWPYVGPGQRRLLYASILVLVGSVMPWVDTAAGNFLGVQGAGLWTLSAGGIGLAGAFLRRRSIVAVHAAVLAVATLFLAGWQLLHLLPICAGGGCVPGVGLGGTLLGGAVAATALVGLARSQPRTA